MIFYDIYILYIKKEILETIKLDLQFKEERKLIKIEL